MPVALITARRFYGPVSPLTNNPATPCSSLLAPAVSVPSCGPFPKWSLPHAGPAAPSCSAMRRSPRAGRCAVASSWRPTGPGGERSRRRGRHRARADLDESAGRSRHRALARRHRLRPEEDAGDHTDGGGNVGDDRPGCHRPAQATWTRASPVTYSRESSPPTASRYPRMVPTLVLSSSPCSILET